MKCRHCGSTLRHTFIDLGSAPPSNAYLTDVSIRESEKWYPLKVLVCHHCWLVQTEDFVGSGEMFSEDYAYFSSYSSSWLLHAKTYVESVVKRFHLGSNSKVVEIAANDGYLLQYVIENNIPCYGIEPTSSTGDAARKKGIEIIGEFFGELLATKLKQQGEQADLIVANNVLAHVPDINDFVKGFSTLLKPEGVATFEFPYLLNLVKYTQFDTIYHEHYSYLSLTSVLAVFQANGLSVFDVEELSSHGGSLRVYAQRSDTMHQTINAEVEKMRLREESVGIRTLDYYQGFQQKAEKVKMDLLEFLVQTRKAGKKIAAYGAAAKGNTMMNFAGIRPDLLSYVVDKNPNKQGKFMPGSRIAIVTEDALKFDKPEYVILLPWNLEKELMVQLQYIRQWGGKFVIAIPNLKLL